jgi:hypothetical protein
MVSVRLPHRGALRQSDVSQAIKFAPGQEFTSSDLGNLKLLDPPLPTATGGNHNSTPPPVHPGRFPVGMPRVQAYA